MRTQSNYALIAKERTKKDNFSLLISFIQVIIRNIGAKNAYRIFAGGNHSWVVIDEIIPMKRNYRPSLPGPDNKTMQIIDIHS